MTFQTPSGFTQIDTDNGIATITADKPNLEIVGTGGTTTSATSNTITVFSAARVTLVDQANAPGGAGLSEVVLNSDGAEPYLVIIQDYNPTTSGSFLSMQGSADGGNTWQTSGYQSSVKYWLWSSTVLNNDTSTTSMRLSGPMRNDRSAAFSLWLGNVEIGSQLVMTGESTWHDTVLGGAVKGLNMGDAPIPPSGYNALRFFSSSGNILNGRFRLYSFS